jgi:hypothetical protein
MVYEQAPPANGGQKVYVGRRAGAGRAACYDPFRSRRPRNAVPNPHTHVMDTPPSEPMVREAYFLSTWVLVPHILVPQIAFRMLQKLKALQRLFQSAQAAGAA